MKSNQRILAVFIEPTPYILGLLLELEAKLPGKIDVFFLKENHTQNWNLTLPAFCTILSFSVMKTAHFLTRQIMQKKYSLIHLAGWGNLVCLYLLLWARIKRIPVSIESDTQLYNNHGWKRVVKYWLYQRPLYPMLFKLPSVFLPGGSRQAQYLQHYGVNQEKLVLAQMTVDIKGLQQKISEISQEEQRSFREQLNAQQGDVVFLFVGRLLEWKGIKELIEAFKNLSLPCVRLWVVGTGPLEDHVKKCASSDEKIHYFGREAGEQLIRIYHAADVLVLPSTIEQWGLVVNEAMAAGNAIIVCDNVGCVDDLILHNKTGLLVPPKDIDALTKAMADLAGSPDYVEKLQKQAKKHISTWTLENEAKNVVRAWQHVLGNG